MKLSEDQFSTALAALGCGESAAPVENRSKSRVPLGTRATIIPCSELGRREQETVVLLNISDTGVGFLSTVAMRKDDTFILRVPPMSGRPALAILSTVVHYQTFATGMYAHGAQFTRVLPGKIEATVPGPTFKTVEDFGEADMMHLQLVEHRLSEFMAK